MPAIRTPYDRAVFRAAFPRENAWVTAHPVSITSNDVLASGNPVPAAEMIAEELNLIPEAPAEIWHAWGVRNGDYAVRMRGDVTVPADTEDIMLRIHLVQEGPLSGLRIIKVKPDASSVYRGFAFVTRNGDVQVWRRFESEIGSLHHRAAEHLVQILSEIGLRSDTFGLGWLPMHDGDVYARVNVFRCAFCNRPTAQQASSVYLCAVCGEVPPRPVRETTQVGTATTPRNWDAIRITEERMRRVEEQAPVTPLMCEVTNKYVR